MHSYLADERFNPTTATTEEILERASRLVGQPIGDCLSPTRVVREAAPGNLGRFGHLLESYFNIVPNSSPEPDFSGAGIELKSVPLKRRPGTGGLKAKERTSVSMIDYHSLVEEQWQRASVRKKLARILFVFFEHLPGRAIHEFPVLAVELWSPDAALADDLRRDWEVVLHKVSAGLAHEISEGDGRILGAATKGPNAERTVTQPRSSIRAKSRAWALKPSLTSALYDQIAGAGRRRGVISLRDQLGLSIGVDFELEVLLRLNALAGLRISDVAKRLQERIADSKGAAHRIVRRALGIIDDKARLKEFEDRGILIKTVPVAPDGSTYEAMSFPYFRYAEYAEEEWQDSEFLTYIQRLLIVPIGRAKRTTPLADRILGRAFFWSPSAGELGIIREEWTRIRDLIRDGKANNLPSYGATELIHARPHGRDSRDVDSDPILGPLPKHCLWLNPAFTARLVKEYGGIEGIRI